MKKKEEKLKRGWKHLSAEEQKIYWQNNCSGEKNPMYGKGHLIKEEKNGRAKKFEIIIDDIKFLVHGKLTCFSNTFKNFFNCSDPLRSEGFIKKYNVKITEVMKFQDDGIAFIDEKSFYSIKERIFTKCKIR
jgi:hypothetical protein